MYLRKSQLSVICTLVLMGAFADTVCAVHHHITGAADKKKGTSYQQTSQRSSHRTVAKPSSNKAHQVLTPTVGKKHKRARVSSHQSVQAKSKPLLHTKNLTTIKKASTYDEPYLEPDYVEQTSILRQAYQLNDQALNARMQGNYDLAIANLSKMVSLLDLYYGKNSVNCAPAYLTLGEVCQEAGKAADAESAYGQALECKPDFVAGRLKLASVLASEGKMEGALMQARLAVETDAGNREAHLLYGLLLKRTGSPEAGGDEERQAEMLKQAEAQTVSTENENQRTMEGSTETRSETQDNEGSNQSN